MSTEKIISCLDQEHKKLMKQKEMLLLKIDEARNNQTIEDSDLVLYNFNSELKFILTQIEKIEDTLRTINQCGDKVKRKIGDRIKIGDCVKLDHPEKSLLYYITASSQYVDPSIGLISASSPLAEQILQNKFGDRVSIGFNGDSRECLLLP
ncbi:MAG: GreA/GreB family elongation factor [bacterium]